MKKLLSLKLLNFFQNYKPENKLLITQNSTLETKTIALLKKGFDISNHMHLPNAIFFETAGTYINTEGTVNKVAKVVTSSGQTKSD